MKLSSLLMLAVLFTIGRGPLRPDDPNPIFGRTLRESGCSLWTEITSVPDPRGKRLLFVDGDNLRPEPGGKRLLYIDQDGDVRPEPGGVRLAHWDGGVLRKSPGGPRLGLIGEYAIFGRSRATNVTSTWMGRR